MNQTTTIDKLSKGFTKAGGKNAGVIPWELIFQAFLQFIQGCSTKNAKATAKAHPALMASAFGTHLGEEVEDLSKRDRNLIAGVAVELFNSTSVAQVDELR